MSTPQLKIQTALELAQVVKLARPQLEARVLAQVAPVPARALLCGVSAVVGRGAVGRGAPGDTRC